MDYHEPSLFNWGFVASCMWRIGLFRLPVEYGNIGFVCSITGVFPHYTKIY